MWNSVYGNGGSKQSGVSLLTAVLLHFHDRLLDLVAKHQLFYYVGLFYFFTFSCVAWMLTSDTYGLGNTDADPSRLLGTCRYIGVDGSSSCHIYSKADELPTLANSWLLFGGPRPLMCQLP